MRKPPPDQHESLPRPNSGPEHLVHASAGGEASPPRIDFGPLSQRLGYVVRRAQMAIFQNFYQVMATAEISPAQYSALVIIACNPGLSQTQVANALGIKKANFVALIRELERRGFVERRAIPEDKRLFALHLSSAGQLAYAELDRLASAHESTISQSIGEETYRALFAPLARIADLGSEANGREEKD